MVPGSNPGGPTSFMDNKIVLSSSEETSIKLHGNFDQNSYSINLKLALFKSLAMDTKISDEIKTTQDNNMPKIFVGQYSEWHNGYFIAVCEKK